MNKQEHQSKNKKRPHPNRNKSKNYYRKPKAIPQPDKHLDDLYRQLIRAFKHEMKLIVSYIKPCSEEQLMWSLGPNDLNIKQQSGHLLQYMEFHTKVLEAFIAENEFSESFDIKKESLSECFNNSSIERILSALRKSENAFLKQLYSSEDSHWEKNFPFQGEESTISNFLTDISAYISRLRDDVFMNLQRHKPWDTPLEKMTS